MRNPALPKGKAGTSRGPTTKSAPEDLVQLLVDRVSELNGHSALTPPEDHAEEVILDVDLNGARYLLVRLPKASKPGVQLSPREREIVRMVALGHPNKVIADVLGISTWTVCTHLRRIFAKLGVGSRAGMVARLHEVGQLDTKTAVPPNTSERSSSTGDAPFATDQRNAARRMIA